MKRGRKPLGDRVNVTVCVNRDAARYLTQKAKASGLGTRSALLRYVITQMMNDEGLPAHIPAVKGAGNAAS